MWIFSRDAFLSVVQVKDNPDMLLVRGRVKGDIESVFPCMMVTESEDHDYRFRAVVRRTQVANAVRAMVDEIDYGNFKDTIKEHRRHWAYLDVWSAMAKFQDDMVFIEDAKYNRKDCGGQLPLPGLGRVRSRTRKKVQSTALKGK